jgi:uncharacterized protein (DUF1778 family)
MTQQSRGNQTRSERINVRASASQRSVIVRAAEVSGKSISEFLLDAGCNEAERTLADQRAFALRPEQWDRFVEALDRPVVEKPRLRALLETPGVLD